MAAVAHVLTSSQVLILQTLARAPNGLDRDQLQKKSKTAVNSGNVGPVFKDVLRNYPDSLYALGLVRVEKREGEQVVWYATKAGITVADQYRTRKRPEGAVNVPGKILDPVVRAFMPTRTYGLELYTDDDMEEIRGQLGDDYADVDLTDLRVQMVNRRKQGAFTSDSDRLRRKVEQFQRFLDEHGLKLDSESSAKLSRINMQFAK